MDFKKRGKRCTVRVGAAIAVPTLLLSLAIILAVCFPQNASEAPPTDYHQLRITQRAYCRDRAFYIPLDFLRKFDITSVWQEHAWMRYGEYLRYLVASGGDVEQIDVFLYLFGEFNALLNTVRDGRRPSHRLSLLINRGLRRYDAEPVHILIACRSRENAVSEHCTLSIMGKNRFGHLNSYIAFRARNIIRRVPPS